MASFSTLQTGVNVVTPLVMYCSHAESAAKSSGRSIQHLRSSQPTVTARQIPTSSHRSTCLWRHTVQGGPF